jgi:cytochrome c553
MKWNHPRSACGAPPSRGRHQRPGKAGFAVARALVFVALVASVPAHSQVSSVATAANADVSAGRTIATKGANGAAACMGCHGANGEGNAQGGFPRLAALGRLYIEHQLNSYADGTRQNPVMTPIASGLSADQRAQVAAYYAGLATPGASSKPAAGANAPVLAVRGDDKRGIQSCANCHGPQGIGDAGANPYLAGQNATYLANALAAWKDGSRHNDASGQMPAIAKALTEAQAQAAIAYYASLPPASAGK